MESFDWISIGGGAAGFFGALRFAERCKVEGRNARVLILEASSAPLSKVKISGGGRCNITHHCFDAKKLATYYPRGSKELISVFTRFQPQDIWNWCEERGVRLKIEKDGRVFPQSDDSQTVIDMFLREAKKLNVQIQLRTGVEKIESDGGEILLTCIGGQKFKSKNCLVAAGGSKKIWEILAELGHDIVAPVPSLFSFNISDSRLKDLSGRSFQDVEISTHIAGKSFSSRGPLLITHWGLSGPAILKLSAWAARQLSEVGYQTKISVDFQPELKRSDFVAMFRNLRKKEGGNKIKNFNPKGMNFDYWVRALEHIGFWPTMMWSEISDHQIEVLADEIKNASFETEGKTTNKEEFVTSGGVNLKEVDFKTMRSKKISSLYFAGEVLDIDGVTGGFNFQSAWSTSAIAAESAS